MLSLGDFGDGFLGLEDGRSRRIAALNVPAVFPSDSRCWVIAYGEAPGPRGAGVSGIPFWGDGAGVPLYRALAGAGLVEVPEAAWEEWDGARFVRESLFPIFRGAALSNAYPMCPTDDGVHFRTPRPPEVKARSNVDRIRSELVRARELGVVKVVTMGRIAAGVVQPLAVEQGLALEAFPHPSSQGLLMAAPGKGKGMRLDDLRREWGERLLLVLNEARLGVVGKE